MTTDAQPFGANMFKSAYCSKKILSTLECQGGPLDKTEIAEAYAKLMDYGVHVSLAETSTALTDYLPLDLVTRIICHATLFFMDSPTMVEVPMHVGEKICVYSDIHGDIVQLLYWLKNYGIPTDCQIMFLGDYVDRGADSVEVLLVLFLLKIAFPDQVHLIRGNHEMLDMITNGSKMFLSDCQRVLAEGYYELFNVAFDEMPIAARIFYKENHGIFCAHGGISPWIEINKQLLLGMPKGPARKNILEKLCFTDVLWSDPNPTDNQYPFIPSSRGCGFLYSGNSLKHTLGVLGCTNMIRGHQYPDVSGYSDVFISDKPGLCMNVHSSVLIKGVEERAASMMELKLWAPEFGGQIRLSTQPISSSWRVAHYEPNKDIFWSELKRVGLQNLADAPYFSPPNADRMNLLCARTLDPSFRALRTFSHSQVIDVYRQLGGGQLLPGDSDLLRSIEVKNFYYVIRTLFSLYEDVLKHGVELEMVQNVDDTRMDDLIACVKMLGALCPIRPEQLIEERRLRTAQPAPESTITSKFVELVNKLPAMGSFGQPKGPEEFELKPRGRKPAPPLPEKPPRPPRRAQLDQVPRPPTPMFSKHNPSNYAPEPGTAEYLIQKMRLWQADAKQIEANQISRNN